MMRSLIKASGFLVVMMVSTVAQADLKIAVADTQTALLATDAARQAVEKLQGDMRVQRERMGQLKKELEALELKNKRDSAIMTTKEKDALVKQAESKIQEYRNLAQAVEKRTQEVQNELLQRMIPKMEEVIDELLKANKYDLILEKKNAIYADPTLDITKKITEKLNASSAGAASK